MLFEVLLRPLNTSPGFISVTNGEDVGIGGYPGTSDVQKIFNNSNDRAITFEIEVVDPTLHPDIQHTVNRLVGTCKRTAPETWRFETYSVQSPLAAVRSVNGFIEREGDVFVNGDNTVAYDFTELREIIRTFFFAKYYGASVMH